MIKFIFFSAFIVLLRLDALYHVNGSHKNANSSVISSGHNSKENNLSTVFFDYLRMSDCWLALSQTIGEAVVWCLSNIIIKLVEANYLGAGAVPIANKINQYWGYLRIGFFIARVSDLIIFLSLRTLQSY